MRRKLFYKKLPSPRHMDILKTLSEELNIPAKQVEAAVSLIDEGNTIPFIARYRKEVTGGLDDTQLRDLETRLTYLRSLDARRTEVRDLIAAQEKLTPEIESALENATILAEIEDIYRPFRPKRKTRASVARERGLTPLAEALREQRAAYEPSLPELAASFINEELGVLTAAEALAGAADIIAEEVSDNADYRRRLRGLTREGGVISTVQSGEGDSVYAMYYDYSERVAKIAPHRVLAVNRGEKEGILKVSLTLDPESALSYLYSKELTKGESPAKPLVKAAIDDSYTRLIAPSVEREIRTELTDAAQEGAIKVFADNLRHLLMQAPIKGKTVMGLDPGYRTGCKLAVVDKTGRVVDTAVIYPTKPHERIDEAKRKVKSFITKYHVDAVAIGNGTASRESERFIADTLREMEGCDCKYVIVSEAGASVYSASKLAAEEFPDFDVTQRSAVSIARRLQDPMAELVKIEPRAIGVGQYQHDMKPARLDEALGGVVEASVNAVGVDINTASHALLSYVAGINATLAKNIVKYREEHGEFATRADVMAVPRMGEKAYQQCAGFLRVPGGSEILDNTGVHPESYEATHKLLKKYKYSPEDVRDGNMFALRYKIHKDGTESVCRELGVGEPTLVDIVSELEKPGRDVRDSFPAPVLREDVLEMSDLQPGMTLTGTVRNVTDFGAFVDIGVHQDGLLHISEISDKFIRHPSEMLAVGDVITVKIKSVDTVKGRIALTAKGLGNPEKKKS